MPDKPLKGAVVDLWYNDWVPKPNIKVVFIQTTLILLMDHLQYPYGIPRPLPNPVSDVVMSVNIHREAEGLCVPDSATVVAEHPLLLRGVISGQGIGCDGCCLHELRVHGLALVIPL